MRRPLWRSRRGTVTAMIVAAVVVLVVAVAASLSALRTVAGGASTVQGTSPVVSRESCGQAAVAWMMTFTDRSLPVDAWASRMESLTAPPARQALAGVDRAAVPTGGVGVVEVAADEASCDARVHTGDGQVTAMLLTASDGAWQVQTWGPPSQESE